MEYVLLHSNERACLLSSMSNGLFVIKKMVLLDFGDSMA